MTPAYNRRAARIRLDVEVCLATGSFLLAVDLQSPREPLLVHKHTASCEVKL